MKLSIRHYLAATLSLMFLFTACGDSTSPDFFQNDFSTVPELADTTHVDPVITESGLTYYVIKEGTGKWEVTPHPGEGLRLFRTWRLSNGEILQSSYANNATSPEDVGLYSHFSEPLGLYEGVLGMKLGEHRVIVVPPELGFQNSSPSNQFYSLRNDTLIYEIEIVDILQ